MSLATLPTASKPPAGRPAKKVRPQASFEQQTNWLRRLIWLYIILWLIEGGLRRWFLPSLATPLLLIRDPLVVTIYFMAFAKGLFPVNGFIISGVILAALELVNALAIGHGNPLVALFGVRCDFLHVPLMFVMARVLRRKDLLALAKVAVWITIPYTALLVAQFYEPQSAWVNRGVGDSLEGAGFSGALGHFRPPGTFSFITGPAALYPLFTACWFALVLARKLPSWLMVASGIAILIAIPVSISRLLFLSVSLVAVDGLAALFVGGRFSGGTFFRVVVAAILLPLLALQIPAFRDGMEAFGARWEASTVEGGGFQETIINRVWDSLFGTFGEVGAFGLGTGYSTNVGQKMLTDNVGFGASEAEWGRLLYDNGFTLGFLLVAYRITLAGSMLMAALKAWQRRSPYGLIFASAAFLLVLNGQWGQASILGASIIAGGLTLVAVGENVKLRKSKAEKRKIQASGWKSKVGHQDAAGKGSAAPFAVSGQSKITER